MFRTRFALGIASAALAITSLVSPFAPTANAQVTFRPDLRVNFDATYRYEEKDTYHFRVKNIGAASAMPVNLIARCYYLNTNGTVRHEGDIFMGIASLNQDQQISKVVNCPVTSAHAVYARLKATTPNDLNEANNTAYAPNPLAH